MNPSFLAKSARHITLASALILIAGCAPTKKTPSPLPSPPRPSSTSQCPPKYPQHFVDATQGYSICLPANVHQTSTDQLHASHSTDQFPADHVEFTGFSVPAGTNLTRKNLTVRPDEDEYNLQNSTPFGQLTVGGVTFQRMTGGEASLGHFDEHIVYLWTHAGKNLYFDFGLHSVQPGIIGPPMPARFNEPAQVKITEEIMKTFRPLN